MKNPAPVSVIIPAYNSERFIAEAIASVRAQTLPVDEIIVVDDGSSDATAKVAETLGAEVVRQTNQGVSAARNTGIRKAVNEWVAFLDQDDLWSRWKIEYQFQAISAGRDVDVVSCDMTWFRDEGAQCQPPDPPADEDLAVRYFDEIKVDLPTLGMAYYLSTLIVRRRLMESVGMFDERLRQNEDLECFLRLLAKGRLAMVKKILVHRRIHKLNASTTDPEGAWVSYRQILDWLRENPSRYPPGAARIYNSMFARGLVSTGRQLLDDGQRTQARNLFSESLRRTYSHRAALLWCLSFVSPGLFRQLATVKQRLSAN